MAILRKLPAAVAVAALTATLVGCGNSDIRDERDQAQMERDQAQAELGQTQTELGQTESELEQAQTELEEAQADREAAQAEADRLAQEQMEAEEAAAAAEQARMEEEAARMEAEAAQMEEEAARMEEEAARMEAEEALQAAEEAAAQAAAMAASATAKVLLGVLMDGATNQTDDDPPVDVHTPPEPTVSVSTDGMLMAKAPNVRGYTMADMAPDMIEGWRGATLMNKEGDTAVVYSDIGNDGTKTLLDRYDSARPTATAPRTWTIGPPLTAAGANVLEANAGLIQWSSVTRPDAETMVSGGTAAAPKLTFMGSVHNIPGTFSCTGTACVAPSRFSDGTVQNAAGDTANPPASAVADSDSSDWTFVPAEGVPTYTDDTNYLVFGWWLSKGADGMPDDLTLISPAATGLGVTRNADSTSGANLRGSATYTGAAAGKYAIASATEDMYEGGHFTAMATLMANFDADLTPEAAPNAVVNDRAGIALSGTINNFMTGDVSRPNWMVTLTADGGAAAGAQPVANLGTAIVGADGAAVDNDTNTDGVQPVLATEWSTGGAQKGMGTWTAMFYGNDPSIAETTSTAQNVAGNRTIPGAATGTFNAHIGTADADAGAVGRLQGAFAVNKE